MKTHLVFFLSVFFLSVNLINAQTVFVTSTGKKYHTKNCDLLKEGKKRSMTLTEAKKLGYEPCKPCKADEIVAVEEKKKPVSGK